MRKKNKAGLKGVDEVIRNLNKQLLKKKAMSLKGMILAAAFIRKDMEKTPPLIPVDTGNLRASWFTTPGYIAGRPIVKMGFTANYALLVHEAVGKNIKWGRPGSGPKFFESSLKRNKATILRIIATEMI